MSTKNNILKDCTPEQVVKELIARENPQVLTNKWLKFKEFESLPEKHPVMHRLRTLFEADLQIQNEAFKHVDTCQLYNEFNKMTSFAVIAIEIFGKDERKDWYDIPDENVKRNAACAVAICKKGALSDNKDGFKTLKVRRHADANSLDRCWRFRAQPVASIMTGFLVTEDVVATVRHDVINNTKVKDIRFVFGYKMCHFTDPGIRIPNENIYDGSERICCGEDWALIRLDREVVGQEIAKFPKEERTIPDDQKVYAIGHPRGLPLKYSPGAKVCPGKNIKGRTYFEANLDTSMGNSGSPVFNIDHEVEGIVITSPEDTGPWVDDGYTPISYPDDCCDGKGGVRVTRYTEFIKKINEFKKE
jgi:hypothetical protein